ncbi:ESPR domain-containing protein [Paraburkholderia diazotrophica]|uniref:ESPR domain-containing protein n=1 Tax=Paraburkholderia diazotrophica TaxID=667676 RepID=UPI0031801AFB
MNKIFKTVWCQASRTWVAASEHALGVKKSESGGAASADAGLSKWFRLSVLAAVSLAAMGMIGPFASEAQAAGNIVFCANYGGSYDGYGATSQTSATCTTGVTSWAGGVTPGTGDWTGISADDTQMVINGTTGIISYRVGGASGPVMTMSSSGGHVLLSGVAAGVSPTDAVNMSQLTSLSTSTSTSVSSLSTGLSTTNSNMASLSTSASTGISSLSTGLSTTNSSVASLSTSASTGISSLSTGLSTTNSSVASLSTSASTGIR